MEVLHILLLLICLTTLPLVKCDLDNKVAVFVNKDATIGYLGSIEPVPGGNLVAAFRGVPYAEPPVGKLRFMPPVKLKEVEKEEKLRNATTFKNACLQWDLFRGRGVVGSEDCLFLNIYRLYEEAKPVPLNDSLESRAHAVMVFFHGVGFIAGHPDTYNPEYLVQKGVIVVTVQYRLGALGFLSSGDKRQPGNMGLLDQVMALTWIQENIKWFGGDANRVTIFGESAGAVAVSLHLCSPLTKGLFSNAIIQSGTALAPFSVQRKPMQHLKQLAANLGCRSNSVETMLDCIKASDPFEIVQQDSAPTSGRKKSSKQQPNPGPVVQYNTVDDWPTYLPLDPTEAFHTGKFHRVPVVIGVNRDESASAVLSNLIPKLLRAREQDASYAERIFLRKVVHASNIHQNEGFCRSAIRFEYFKNYNMSDIEDLKQEYITLHSDFSVVAPVYRTAMFLSQRTYVYFYSFEYEGELSFSERLIANSQSGMPRRRQLQEVISKRKLGGQFYSDPRYVIHGEELLYLFRFRNPTTGQTVDVEDKKGLAVRDTLCTLWSNMAKYGSPSVVPLKDGNKTRTLVEGEWKPFSPQLPSTYRITDRTRLLPAYRHRKMLFWTFFIPSMENQSCSQ